MDERALSRAVDHLSDAVRFARESLSAAERGNGNEVTQFIDLARKASEDGAYELGQAQCVDV